MKSQSLSTRPFPGLRPFEFDEHHLFFGRAGQSQELLEKLISSRFLAVIGASGIGKTSLVRAGLLPMLLKGVAGKEKSHWQVAWMRPGEDSIGSLTSALTSPGVLSSTILDQEVRTAVTEATLRRSSLGLIELVRRARLPPGGGLLIVIDQFEDLFRFGQMHEDVKYKDEATIFIRLLLEAVQQDAFPIYVVLTMRAEYLGDCAEFWNLPESINRGHYLVPRMSRDECREAIMSPVKAGGASIAHRLVERLLNDAGSCPDLLPIFQHALMRTWEAWKREERPDEPVDLSHYEASGGVAEALMRHAEEVYDGLPNERARHIAEKLFMALVAKSGDELRINGPLKLKKFFSFIEAQESEVVDVIEHFRSDGRSFIAPPATWPLNEESLIEIPYEGVIHNWPRLREWANRADLPPPGRS